ncbi:DNA repair protein RecO [Pseudohalioglobus lutimaris]|uniref:DNA repair protein RecO n=1 Tax=Pseudohalioglobus lutimaris TaxID=1737061 RepID=A0A2N5X0J6_9GAMM|nr:DNA repair protein RecO [Pseudohalioglobus lutimaris]PLW68017.1 DNA repair protein RecO [Pseudohalioglobus lutimaris]
MRVNLQPSYILHSRAYRDSSLILEVFTAEHGRLSLVAKGARRRARGGSTAALLQPFIPLLLSFSGRGEMKTLTQVESAAAPVALRAEQLYSAMYVNEVLMRLLHRHDPHPLLFAAYGQVLQDLTDAPLLEAVLRRFELGLLDALGYGFSLQQDGSSGDAIEAEGWYHFHPDFGLIRGGQGVDPSHPAYSGGDLLAMSRGEFAGDARLAARRLMRQALAQHLGDAPLKSRDLFRGRLKQTGEQR